MAITNPQITLSKSAPAEGLSWLPEIFTYIPAPGNAFSQGVLGNIIFSLAGSPQSGCNFILQTVPMAAAPPPEWHDQEYRQAYMGAAIDQGIAWQVRVNREERGWTQAELAKLVGTGQSAISKLEDPESGDVRLSTLRKVANAFDCALIVRLASYSELANLSENLSPDRLYASSFEDEYGQRQLPLSYGT